MSTTLVRVNTYTHSVTFVTDKMLASLRRIIYWTGLDQSKLLNDWITVERGVYTWLKSHHLVQLILEIFNPQTSKLVGRWDFDISYSTKTDEDGEFWVDTDAIRYAIKKQGLIPSDCTYSIFATTKVGSDEVQGWGPAELRSTEGFVRHC